MFKKIEQALSFKTKAGLVTIGVKSFMAHTPAAAKKAILAICGIGTAVVAYLLSNPTILPEKYQVMLVGSVPIIILVLHALGIKCPFDKDGNPIQPPADQK